MTVVNINNKRKQESAADFGVSILRKISTETVLNIQNQYESIN